jgi:ribonuclease III
MVQVILKQAMNPVEKLLANASFIEERIHYIFSDRKLLMLAFVHRSFFNEHRDLVLEHNERLEFLGDSVLGLIVSEHLYSSLPMEAEGQLSLLRSQIVEASSCAQMLQKLSVSEFILLGRGESMNDGRGRETILSDLFEALIGAIYLDGGFAAAKDFFFIHFEKDLKLRLEAPSRNWKAELQDYSQKKYQKPPIYKVLKESGPDHSKMFHVGAFIDERDMGQGVGSSKKEAAQEAARDALNRLALK